MKIFTSWHSSTQIGPMGRQARRRGRKPRKSMNTSRSMALLRRAPETLESRRRRSPSLGLRPTRAGFLPRSAFCPHSANFQPRPRATESSPRCWSCPARRRSRGESSPPSRGPRRRGSAAGSTRVQLPTNCHPNPGQTGWGNPVTWVIYVDESK